MEIYITNKYEAPSNTNIVENAYYRMKRGLSQDELGDKIAISKSYLIKIKAPSSTKAYSLDVLFAIADDLEVDVIQFLMPIEEKNNNDILTK